MINPANFGRLDPANWADIPAFYTESIWPEKLPSSPGDYGDNTFHGRTHPDIIRVAVERYTKPRDRVWDCMAGSGTTIDVCQELGVSCIASDITPTRANILQRDATQWRPSVPVDLVICHPPYMDIIDYKDGSLSTDDLLIWKLRMEAVFEQVRLTLRSQRVLVVIVGVVYKQGRMICLDYELMDSLKDFRLLGRVIRPFGETKGGAKRTENLWRYRRLKFGIWALNQDIILFLQKP